MLAGSMGMMPSASLPGNPRDSTRLFGLYEPIHGSSPPLAKLDVANPIATILSVAMMLRYSFGLTREATVVKNSIDEVLKEGYRTGDIMSEGKTKVGTKGWGISLQEKYPETPLVVKWPLCLISVQKDLRGIDPDAKLS
jgi:3-isopropylmalate dehydrogenase